MMAYLSYMAERLAELRCLLKPTGSLYLHCDPSASHYLKILMDGVFGPRQFLSEIVWKRTSAHSDAKRWGANHDTILFYAASSNTGWTWNRNCSPRVAADRCQAVAGRATTSGEPGTEQNLRVV